MYSRQEAAQLKQEFWTAFGQYMTPVLNAEGEKINWINYKTGGKDVYFKMEADSKSAIISIYLAHKDAGIRHIYFEHFAQLKSLLHESLTEKWNWAPQTHDAHGKQMSRIYKELTGVSIFRKEDWPALISFFKPRIIALDEFWTSAKYSFEALK